MIENAIYKILKEITKDKADGVYLDFVNEPAHRIMILNMAGMFIK